MIELAGARFYGNLSCELLLAIMVADQVFQSIGQDRTRLTAGANGTHGKRSHHYKGDAVDLGLAHIIAGRRASVGRRAWTELKRRLGPDYVVVLEGPKNSPTHIHVAFRPDPTR